MSHDGDTWVQALIANKSSFPNLIDQGGLWFMGERLIVPNIGHLRETLFRVVHNVFGHFGFDKSYNRSRMSYYWPNMQRDLEHVYIPACIECQWNKSSTN